MVLIPLRPCKSLWPGPLCYLAVTDYLFKLPAPYAYHIPQMLALGFITILAYPTNLTWWAFLLAVFISFGFALPIGIIQAVTNNQIGLNVLTEFVYGYIQPGRPLALMM